MDLASTGISLGENQIPLLKSMISNIKDPGTYHIIDDKIPYDTAKDKTSAEWILGNITLKVEGDFTKHQNGSWEFNGAARAYNDLYDFGASGHRTTFKEIMTTAGRVMSGTEYTIELPGEVQVKLTGISSSSE